MKKCPKCNIEKDLSEFHRRGYKSDGSIKYVSLCKACVKEKDKKRHSSLTQEQIDKRNIHRRKKYSKDPTKQKEQVKKYDEKNKSLYNSILEKMFGDNTRIVTYIIRYDNCYKVGYSQSIYVRLKCLKKYINIQKVYVLNKNIERRLLKELSSYRFSNDKVFSGSTECFYVEDNIMNHILEREGFKEFVV